MPDSPPKPPSRPERDGKSLRLTSTGDASAEAAVKRRSQLGAAGVRTEQLAGEGPEIAPEELAGSIEGFVGFARVPVGVFGPLKIDGQEASGEFLVPVATTEGALVGSYQHVANAIGRTEGIKVRCTDECVWRAPFFGFDSLSQAASFAEWIDTRRGAMAQIAEDGSSYCRLTEVQSTIVGCEVYLRLGFVAGDAAGQNMVTNATTNICTMILDEMPDKPRQWLVEGNFSGDKKATVLSLARTRGKRASAELVLSDKLCRRYFRAGAADISATWDIGAAGAAQSGTVGAQGNYANALAGLFIACGQDVACVAEASAGLTRARVTADGDLYWSVTLPNLIVGTVGGGTYLPTARECLEMLDCRGPGKVKKFAEICAAVVLIGELALAGALTGGSFSRAHADAQKKSEDRRG